MFLRGRWVDRWRAHAPTMARSNDPQRLVSTVAAITTQPDAEPEFINFELKKCSIDSDVPSVVG